MSFPNDRLETDPIRTCDKHSSLDAYSRRLGEHPRLCASSDYIAMVMFCDHSESPTDLDTNIFSVIDYNENPEVFLRIAFSLI